MQCNKCVITVCCLTRASNAHSCQEVAERLEAMWCSPHGQYLNPSAGDLRPARAQRKRDQIVSMCRAIALVAEPGYEKKKSTFSFLFTVKLCN